MDKNLFKNQYRVASARLAGWDYTTNGYYFITICTKNRQCAFGSVVEGVMINNQYGQIIQRYWHEIPIHFPRVTLDQFVVMPNHIHGIIIISNKNKYFSQPDDDALDARRRDEALPRLYQMITPKKGSIASIVGSFKSKCTKEIHDLGYKDFAWQQRYYDHIIRNEQSLNRICQYIIDNPLRWQFDRNHPQNMANANIVAGNRGEHIAAQYLRAKDYHIIERNYRVRDGEIDLICRQGRTLVFVEVKTRSSRAGGFPEEAVTRRKLSRLHTAVAAYLEQYPNKRGPIRIDVISIELGQRLLPNIIHFQNVIADDLTKS